MRGGKKKKSHAALQLQQCDRESAWGWWRTGPWCPGLSRTFCPAYRWFCGRRTSAWRTRSHPGRDEKYRQFIITLILMDLLQRWKQVFGVFCGHSQASRQICGRRSPCAGSSALWRMYSNVWPNLTRREVVLQGTKKVRHTHTHTPGTSCRKKRHLQDKLLTFFLHVEVAFTADGAGLSVLLRRLPDPLHQLVHLWPRGLEPTSGLGGRGSKQTLVKTHFPELAGWVETVLVRSRCRSEMMGFPFEIHSNLSEIRL